MVEFEFHISRTARNKYQFEESLFSLDGRAVIADFSAARRLAESMTKVRGQIVPASDINAMGLIDEILHIIVRQYEMQNPGIMQRALGRVGSEAEAVLVKFIDDFPPLSIYHGEVTPPTFLDMEIAGRSNRASALEELLILHITNLNPATQQYKELFDDESLKEASPYDRTIQVLKDFFHSQAGFQDSSRAEHVETLIDVLLAPSRVAPHSLTAQLEFLIARWGGMLGESFVMKILRGIDFVKEEAIRATGPGGFGGQVPVLSFGTNEYAEYERYSPDKDWMPRLVLIAKNSYVWLDQLSKKYQSAITHLDQIPDEELNLLQQRGITGLWLIGLWERSLASQRMKQMMGQPDAVASAYSLMDYQIASDLGGWEALQNLRYRAWQRGIRLSADMVPNHMGIDSRWVVEHPDWFLSLSFSPYSNYIFNGTDLSNDSRVGIFLEDHYYDHTDAAVVFKRIDRWVGDVRYIYHGNDGTSMPWNDTAQLDYSKKVVREAVIQTILHVARNFPIIRFDAAMTLAKKHIQRLWFPEPGSGGAIPSRSEHGMTRTEFDNAIPEEFWREVVDRVAAEVPDTLLLAEAFWLMEGYFVRTLGMHRVYNSAFMHMLRDEDNAKYRTVMKNVLEFDPQVIKRFVNFMNNPDEKTAVEQFGDGDKYFGICTLMATLPGLPMIGHGQIEGYYEKYGMEYRRAKWEEQPNEGLIKGHEWKIFPLLHRRKIFSEVDHFLLYDFFTTDGNVNEDVFAHSNRLSDERGLVIYNNKYNFTSGWVKTSVSFMNKATGELVQRTLAEGLELPNKGYVICRDYVTHLEHVFSCQDLVERGLHLELGGYQCYVFMDWRFVDSDEWRQVYEALKSSGVLSVQAKYDEMFSLKVTESLPEKVKVTDKKKPTTKKSKVKASRTKSRKTKDRLN